MGGLKMLMWNKTEAPLPLPRDGSQCLEAYSIWEPKAEKHSYFGPQNNIWVQHQQNFVLLLQTLYSYPPGSITLDCSKTRDKQAVAILYQHHKICYLRKAVLPSPAQPNPTKPIPVSNAASHGFVSKLLHTNPLSQETLHSPFWSSLPMSFHCISVRSQKLSALATIWIGNHQEIQWSQGRQQQTIYEHLLSLKPQRLP